MKKLLAIVLAIVMVVSVAAPAAAASTSVGTGVTISGSSGNEPIVLAKWETPDANPAKTTPPTQISHNTTYLGTSPIKFCVVVYDNPITDVSLVSVDVFHPAVPYMDDPRTTAPDPQASAFKFEVILTPYNNGIADGITEAEAQAVVDLYNAAVAAGLVTTATGPYPFGETIPQLLAQGEAYLWCGEYWLDYHQPAGIYLVDAFAKDTGPVDASSHLLNNFEFVAVTALETDFTSISYGSITVDGLVSGDMIFGNTGGGPTLRNIGNTWFNLQIQQDDMGFGITEPGSVWNVQFDARVGSLIDYPKGGPSIGGTTTVFSPAFAKGPTSPDPAKWTTLPGTIHLCNTWKIDFSIHIIKSTGENYSGKMWLQPQYVPFTAIPQVDHPGS